MNQKLKSKQPDCRFAFIQARWHADFVDECRKTFIDECQRLTNGTAIIDVFDVPGAFEIPLLAKKLAATGRYDAIVGCAFVVNGGIYRHDFVASTVVSALMQVQLETDVPVLSAVLTPHNFHESDEHRSFFLEHFKVKGREAASAAMAVVTLANQMAA
ncbi:MAG: 6,7-dimethyl-8-ribityllumazine synthase [Beijerinckiaceae bacterium]